MTPGPYDQTGAWAGDAGDSLGAVLARVRVERGKSQLRLAELLCAASGAATITRHEVSRWEREERIPTVYWLRWLAVVLEIPLDELELAAGRSRGRRTGRPPWPTGLAPATDIAQPWPVRPPVTQLAALTLRIAELRRMDDLVGGADLLHVVRQQLVTALAGQVPRLGRAGSAAVADLAQLLSWVAADAGAPQTVLAAHRLGARMAAAAGDRPLAGHLLGSLSQLTAEEGDPRRALRLARLARDRAAPMSSATTRALQWHRVAFAAARAGQRRTCEQALNHAEQAYARRDPQRDPSWLYWFDEAHFTAMTGRCYAALGRVHLARPLLTAALASGRIRLRAAAVHGAWLAGLQAEAHDLDGASAVASEALLNAVRTGSVRAARHVRALDGRLLVASTDPAVRDYAELRAAARPYLADPGRLPVGRRRPGPASVNA